MPMASSRMSLQDFDVGAQIGRGAYGDVFLCTRKADGQTLCLKEMNLDLLQPAERDRCLAEVELSQRLAPHPNIVTCYDAFWAVPERKLVLLLEYADAGDLDQRIHNEAAATGPVCEANALEIFMQIARGVAFLHEQQILHRDLKSKNVFLFHDGRVVLGDFGTSKVLATASCLASTLIGSPLYMSPEILDDQPYSFATDIWSLGCILYELLTLRHAFGAASYPGVVMKVTQGKFELLGDHLSDGLRALVNQMLQLDPEHRPSIQSVLKQVHGLLPACAPLADTTREEAEPTEAEQASLAVEIHYPEYVELAQQPIALLLPPPAPMAVKPTISEGITSSQSDKIADQPKGKSKPSRFPTSRAHFAHILATSRSQSRPQEPRRAARATAPAQQLRLDLPQAPAMRVPVKPRKTAASIPSAHAASPMDLTVVGTKAAHRHT